MRFLTARILIGVLASAPALANDTTAELASGGLVFVRNPIVEMRSEQLFVSSAQVRVTYHFFNTSDQPVTNLVAFPLPDITVDSPDWNVSVPTEEPVNFLAFSTQANGQKVTTQVEQKVFAMGVDRTAMLQSLGLPLAPQLKTTYDALDALPKDKWQELIDLGMTETDEYGNTPDGKMTAHLEPRWTLKTTYYWQQSFPPKTELVIEHLYKPSLGASVGTQVGYPVTTSDPQFVAEQKARTAAYTAKYCMDASFIAAELLRHRGQKTVADAVPGALHQLRPDNRSRGPHSDHQHRAIDPELRWPEPSSPSVAAPATRCRSRTRAASDCWRGSGSRATRIWG